MQAWKAHGHICITLGTNWVLAKQDSTRLGTQGLGSCFSELAIHAYVRGVAVSCLLAVPAAVPVQVLRPEGGVLRVNALYADGQQGCLISKVDGSLASGEGGGQHAAQLRTRSSRVCLCCCPCVSWQHIQQVLLLPTCIVAGLFTHLQRAFCPPTSLVQHNVRSCCRLSPACCTQAVAGCVTRTCCCT
jgi:hypothetical protein